MASLEHRSGRATRSTGRATRRCGNWSVIKVPVVPEGPVCAAGAHDQADRDAGNHALGGCIRARRGEWSLGIESPAPYRQVAFPV